MEILLGILVITFFISPGLLLLFLLPPDEQNEWRFWFAWFPVFTAARSGNGSQNSHSGHWVWFRRVIRRTQGCGLSTCYVYDDPEKPNEAFDGWYSKNRFEQAERA